MPMTPTYGFEYETPMTKPGITLTGNSDGSSPILAEQVEVALAGVDARLAAAEGSVAVLEGESPSDTGWQNLSVAPAGGYSLIQATYRLWGPIASIYIQLERTGGNFPANSQGNVTDTNICTINTVEARPSQLTHALVRITLTSGTVDIGTNGVVTIVDMHSDSVISTNDNVRLAHTFFGPTFN